MTQVADSKRESDSPGDFRPEFYQVWTTSWLLRKTIFEKSLPAYRAAMWVFILYWFVPLLMSIFSGTLLPAEKLQALADSPGKNIPDILPLADWLAALAKTQSLDAPGDQPYLSDSTHFLFSLIIAVGAGLATTVLRNFHTTVIALRQSGIPLAEERQVISLYVRYKKLATHWSFKGVSLFLGIFTFIIFLSFAHSEQHGGWWGHINYGVSGHVFAVIEGLMVYWGTRIVLLISMGSLMLGKLMQFPLELRPYHSDGCNGLAPLGCQIVYLWFLALTIAFAIYITLSFGYLGIEEKFITWMLAFLGTLAIPALAVLPLFCSMRAIQIARRKRLGKLEDLLDKLLKNVEQASTENDYDKAEKYLEYLKHAQAPRDIVNTANVWPFNPRALFGIFLVNLIQIIVTMDELSGIFFPD